MDAALRCRGAVSAADLAGVPPSDHTAIPPDPAITPPDHTAVLADPAGAPFAAIGPSAETITVELTGLDPRGEATGRAGDDDITAAFGIPGELVELEVWERKPGRVWGRVTRVLRPAPERVDAPCTYFGHCGGCQWQHIAYARQLEYKRSMVGAALAGAGLSAGDPTASTATSPTPTVSPCAPTTPTVSALAGAAPFDGARPAEALVLPTLAAPESYGYRNHGRFSIGRRYGEVGFTSHYRHRFFRVDRCPIMHPRINEVLAASQRRAAGHQLAVRVGTRTGELLIQPAQPAPELPYESGQTALHEELLGRRYRVSAAAFFQVNTPQAERLIETVRAALDPNPDDILLDLYCGVGTFGLALASKVRRVIGVEESAAALKDAYANAADLPNVEFRAGRAEEVLPSLGEPAGLAVVDPPRVGCRPAALQALIDLAPRRLVYVSCDAATLARDLRVLVDGGFTLRSVQPVDMFPQTYHVETVSLLTREHHR